MSNELDTAGNRNPAARYAGYKDTQTNLVTKDKKLAWEEGYRARLGNDEPKTLCKSNGCNAVNGIGHSSECEAEHDECYNSNGIFNNKSAKELTANLTIKG